MAEQNNKYYFYDLSIEKYFRQKIIADVTVITMYKFFIDFISKKNSYKNDLKLKIMVIKITIWDDLVQPFWRGRFGASHCGNVSFSYS